MFKPAMPGRAEFIALIASIMMIVAFAIDAMLPALPAIGESLGVADETRRALVISAFTIGFGVAQLFVGTISDRYGRRALMLVSLVAFAMMSVVAAAATSFTLLLAARAAEGIGAAGARVLATSVVRDRFEGREMAQVMSLAAAVFMAAPIIAPFMGVAVLAVAPWPWIFIVLALVGAAIFVWVLFRLPETLPVAARRPISLVGIADSARVVLSDRQSVGYTIANTGMTVAIMGFLTSVQLIFANTFESADLLPYGFAIMAGSMAVASVVNSRIVMRFGMRRIGHLALIGFTAIAAIHAGVSLGGYESLVGFVVLQSLMMMCFSLTVGNFGAMAMENMGSVAGTASSLQGFVSSVVGGIGGALIGLNFDGTTFPLYAGITLAGIGSLVAVFVAEGGRLFVARHEGQKATQEGV